MEPITQQDLSKIAQHVDRLCAIIGTNLQTNADDEIMKRSCDIRAAAEPLQDFLFDKGASFGKALDFGPELCNKLCASLTDLWNRWSSIGWDHAAADSQRYEWVGCLDALSALLSPGPLTTRQIDILYALQDLNATDCDSRRTATDIAVSVGNDVNEEALKRPLADLKRLGIIDSKVGRGGGSWLTPVGLQHLEKM